MSQLVKELMSEGTAELSFADLDAQLRLKVRSTLALAFPVMYSEFSRCIDVGAMRSKGIGSVIGFVEVTRALTPLPVGGKVGTKTSIRLIDHAAEGQAPRLGFEVMVRLSSAPGTGNPLDYRGLQPGGTVSEVGTCRVLFTMLRPFAPKSERFVTSPPEEVLHMSIERASQAQPTVDALGSIDGEPCARRDPDATPIVWGMHNSDVNQNVYTGDLVGAFEDAFSDYLLRGDVDLVGHEIERASVLFKKPFAPGKRAVIDGAAYREQNRTTLVAGMHGFASDGSQETRPSVVARLHGRLGLKHGQPG